MAEGSSVERLDHQREEKREQRMRGPVVKQSVMKCMFFPILHQMH